VPDQRKRAGASLVLAVTAVLALLTLPAVATATAGSLDPTFGSAGVASLAVGTELNAVALQADGQIVATGDSGSSVLVQRFSASGATGSTFAAGPGVGRGVVVQSDGKIVVAGSDAGGMLVERFNSDGSLDAGFGSGGKVHALAGARANAVALGPNGTIIAAGQVTAGDSFQRVAIVRLNSNGSPDASIGPGGVHVVDLGQDSVAKAVAVQGDGKIVVAGSIGPGAHQAVVAYVVRLAVNGALDTSFGSGGAFVSYPQAGGAASTFNAVALDPSGGIVVGGGSTATNQSRAVFARLTCSGALDSSFAGSGLEVTLSSQSFVTDPLGANAVAVAAGHRLVGAGEYRDSGLTSAALWSFEPDGSPDFANFAPSGARSTALVVDPAGNLVVAGSNVPLGFAPSGFVARYTGFGAPSAPTSPCGGIITSPPPPPVRLAPSLSTGPASGVTSSRASLSGSVNPNGEATSYHFDYGTSTAYGSHTPAISVGSGRAAVAASATVSGLAPGTRYHYRLVASNATGTAHGADETLTTGGNPLPRPLISSLSQSHRIWAETKSRTRRRAVGTTFSFTLNVSARVDFAFTQQVGGRKVNGRCIAEAKTNRGKPSCTRSVTSGVLFLAGHAGQNRYSFQGRISRSNRLRVGDYTLVVSATNAVGRKSKLQSLRFTIVP
jgi:uncharacterized delta-60 repeat protein